MASTNSSDAWGDFWALNSRPGRVAGAGEAGGCLPQRWAAIENAQKASWLGFIESLSDKANVLDLATGDGRVMLWMLAKRGDLALTGVDLAPQLPPAPAGTQTHAGISMEDLPFADSSFDAVVSQFGFEYGDVKKVTTQIARVLKAGGKVGLLVHRGDGPILEHNLNRRKELLWALKEKAVARKTKAMLKAGSAAIDKAAKAAGKIAEQGARKFGQQSPAWEIPEAIRRSCLMGRRAGVGSIIETIASIEGHAKNELGRISSLGRACQTADKRDAITGAFAAHGISLQSTVSLKEPTGRELADFITFQ